MRLRDFLYVQLTYETIILLSRLLSHSETILGGEILGTEVCLIVKEGLRDTLGHCGDMGWVGGTPGLGVGEVGEHCVSLRVGSVLDDWVLWSVLIIFRIVKLKVLSTIAVKI